MRNKVVTQRTCKMWCIDVYLDCCARPNAWSRYSGSPKGPCSRAWLAWADPSRWTGRRVYCSGSILVDTQEAGPLSDPWSLVPLVPPFFLVLWFGEETVKSARPSASGGDGTRCGGR